MSTINPPTVGAGLLLAGALATATSHGATSSPLPKLGRHAVSSHTARSIFDDLLPRLRATTTVPIYLPKTLPTSNGKLYADVLELSRTLYLVEFSPSPNCQGTQACAFGSIDGFARSDPMAPPAGGTKVMLANGSPAYFNEAVCGGAGCTEATVLLDIKGYRYSVGIKAGRLPELLSLANTLRRR